MNFIAARTLSTGIEGVPRVTALTGPEIGLGGSPVTLGAGDTWDGSQSDHLPPLLVPCSRLFITREIMIGVPRQAHGVVGVSNSGAGKAVSITFGKLVDDAS